MTTETVLASIDDTLAGYDGAVVRDGLDAMRWIPERVICDGGRPLEIKPAPGLGDWTFGARTIIPGLSYEMTASSRCGYPRCDCPACEPPGTMLGASATLVAYDELADFSAALHRVLKSLRGLSLLLACAAPRPHQAARCRTCNPAGNPEPLAVDGREYRRRQKARQRRKA